MPIQFTLHRRIEEHFRSALHDDTMVSWAEPYESFLAHNGRESIWWDDLKSIYEYHGLPPGEMVSDLKRAVTKLVSTELIRLD